MITKCVRILMTLATHEIRLLSSRIPKKISAYQAYVSEAVQKNSVQYKEALAAWRSLTIDEKADYAKSKANENPSIRISIKPDAVVRRYHIYRVFIETNKELMGDGEKLAEKWKNLSLSEKENLQKQADDLNESLKLDTSNLDELDKGVKVNPYFLFAKEVSTKGLRRSTITSFWNNLPPLDQQYFKVRAEYLSEKKSSTSARLKIQSEPKSMSSFVYFCVKKVRGGFTLAEAREKWRGMSVVEKADFTKAAVLENPLVKEKEVKVETKPFSAHMVYLLEGIAAGKDEKALASEWLLLTEAGKSILVDKASEKNISAGLIEKASHELDATYGKGASYHHFILKVVGHGVPLKYAIALWNVLDDDEKNAFKPSPCDDKPT